MAAKKPTGPHLSDPLEPVDESAYPERPLEDAIDPDADTKHHGYVEGGDVPVANAAVVTTSTGTVHEFDAPEPAEVPADDGAGEADPLEVPEPELATQDAPTS